MLEGCTVHLNRFSICIAWKPSTRHCLVEGFVLAIATTGSSQKTKRGAAVFFLGGAMRKTRGILVPKLNGRSSRQPVTIGCQHGRGDYMGRSWAQTWIPSWYIYIYMSIYLINTFMCYFRRFYVFIFCCVSKILTTLNSQGMPPLTYALSNILEQQGFLMRKSVSWCLWSIANWYVQIRNYTPGN